MNDDAELLRRYCEEGANDAFSELVERHVNLVYSAALRRLNGDAHLAADATQFVFTDLARKAGSLRQHRVLAGWLFTSTRYATAKLVRGERRRQAREAEAHLMEQLQQNTSTEIDWPRVRPVLDDVIAELNESDREAILLRFFEGRNYASVGARLNLNDNTARMRVERALEKMRQLLERRGVKSTATALGVALADQAVMAAPAGLAASVAGAAIATGTGFGGGAFAATLMGAGKISVGVAVAVVGAAGIALQQRELVRLQAELDTLHHNRPSLAQLRSEHAQLVTAARDVAALRQDESEVLRLRDEAATVKALHAAAAARSVAEQSRAAMAPLAGPVFDISELDRTPQPKFQSAPQYPFEMRRAGVRGEVVVDFVVDSNGDVQSARAIRSSRPEFESAAVQAVSRWRFSPGQKSGQSVNAHLQVPIVFTLGGETKIENWF